MSNSRSCQSFSIHFALTSFVNFNVNFDMVKVAIVANVCI